MNSFDHAHSWYTCPDGFFLSSLRRGLPADCNHLGCIDEAKCCRPKGAGRWGLCQVQDWWQSMSSEGSSTCPFPKAVAGLYRGDVSDLRGIGLAYCCELGVPTSDLVFETYRPVFLWGDSSYCMCRFLGLFLLSHKRHNLRHGHFVLPLRDGRDGRLES